ncbi:energy-coupled thiamine transporter ThiT, partial [Treponema sp. R6D11]
MKKFNTKELVLGAVMLALATILSYIKVYQAPYGGSITLLSMLPIIVFALYSGLGKGLIVSFLYGVIQLYAGGDSPLGWGLTGYTLAMCLLFDYILAFGVLGLAGLFKGKKTPIVLSGVVFAIFLRFLCHFVSGVTIWANFEQFKFMGKSFVNPYLYPLVYNGAY